MNDFPPIVCASVQMQNLPSRDSSMCVLFLLSLDQVPGTTFFFCECCIRKSDPNSAKIAWVKCKLTKIDTSVAIAKLFLVPKVVFFFQSAKDLYDTLNSVEYKYTCHIIRSRFRISECIEHSGMVILFLCTPECLSNLNLMLNHSIT